MSQMYDALSFLVTHQNPDGSWGCVIGSPSDISCTAQVLNVLNACSNQFFLAPVTIPARHFLKATLHPDGSIAGIATDPIYTTALVARALVEAGDELGNDQLTMIAFLQSGQGADGSWEGDPFITAVALLALAGLLQVAPTVEAGTDQTAMEGEPVSLLGANFTDLGILDTHTATIDWSDGTVESVLASADVTASFLRIAEESDGIVLTVRIGNGGTKAVGSGVPVSFYDGDATSGGVLLGTGNTTSSLFPGQFEDVSITLPPGTTSAALSGS
jgi:hypothetical protein